MFTAMLLGTWRRERRKKRGTENAELESLKSFCFCCAKAVDLLNVFKRNNNPAGMDAAWPYFRSGSFWFTHREREGNAGMFENDERNG